MYNCILYIIFNSNPRTRTQRFLCDGPPGGDGGVLCLGSVLEPGFLVVVLLQVGGFPRCSVDSCVAGIGYNSSNSSNSSSCMQSCDTAS